MAVIFVSSVYEINYTESTDLNQFAVFRIMQWVYMTIPPVLILLGTFGNIVIILIPRIGSATTTLFFKALALSDLCLLHLGLFPVWLNRIADISFVSMNDAVCKATSYILYVAGILSAWLISVMTVQRAVCVVWPYRFNSICTPRNSLLLIFVLVAILLLLHTHMIYGLELRLNANNTVPVCCPKSGTYLFFFQKIWSWVDLLSFYLFPSLLLIVSDIVLIWKLMSSARKVTKISTQPHHTTLTDKRTHSVTITLVAVSITFCVLTLPNLIYTILYPYVILERSEEDLEFKAYSELINCLAGLLCYSNSAVNFYLYCFACATFRAAFKRMFTACQVHSHHSMDVL